MASSGLRPPSAIGEGMRNERQFVWRGGGMWNEELNSLPHPLPPLHGLIRPSTTFSDWRRDAE